MAQKKEKRMCSKTNKKKHQKLQVMFWREKQQIQRGKGGKNVALREPWGVWGAGAPSGTPGVWQKWKHSESIQRGV